jgi:hypothetical protein
MSKEDENHVFGYPQGWQPIETAPKDGTILVFRMADSGPFYQLAQWVVLPRRKGRWTCSNGDWVDDVTHWMPLPEPPK